MKIESKRHVILRIASGIFIFLLPILSIGYFLWMRNSIPLIFYVENYREISSIGGLILLVVYVVTISLLLLSLISIKNAKISGIKTAFIVAIFTISTPLCCLSSSLNFYLPTLMDKEAVGKDTYYLTGELEFLDSHTNHGLYKCDNISKQCQRTPFWTQSGASFNPLRLMTSNTSNIEEINVICISLDGSSILEYTYGTQSRFYDYPAQLKDRLYYLAYYFNPEPKSATYMLYECSLDNTLCKELPFRYVGFGYLRNTTTDEETGEINVFIDNEMDQDTLIFTWSEHPRCYVEGCEILEQK